MCNKALCVGLCTMTVILVMAGGIVILLRPSPTVVTEPPPTFPPAPTERPRPGRLDVAGDYSEEHSNRWDSHGNIRNPQTNTAFLQFNSETTENGRKNTIPLWMIITLVVAGVVSTCGGLHCHCRNQNQNRQMDHLHAVMVAHAAGEQPPASPPTSCFLSPLHSFRAFLHGITEPRPPAALPGPSHLELDIEGQGSQGQPAAIQQIAANQGSSTPLSSPITEQPQCSRDRSSPPFPSAPAQVDTSTQLGEEDQDQKTLDRQELNLLANPPGWPQRDGQTVTCPFNPQAPPPSASRQAAMQMVVVRAVKLFGLPDISPAEVISFPWGSKAIMSQILTDVLFRVRELMIQEFPRAELWNIPSHRQAARMLPHKAGAGNIFVTWNASQPVHSPLGISGPALLMTWRPSLQILRELVHPSLMSCHVARLALCGVTRPLFPCPTGEYKTLSSRIKDSDRARDMARGTSPHLGAVLRLRKSQESR